MKLKHFTYFILLVFSLNSCKNDPKETEVNTTETETNVVSTPIKAVKSMSKEIKKIRLDLQVLNESNVTTKGVFSDQAGAVALLASIKGEPQTTYAGEIMELKSNNTTDINSSNLKIWTPNGDKSTGKIPAVVTDDNGRTAMSFSTSSWCIDCEDANKNIKGKVFVISEQKEKDNAFKIVAAGIIE
ncbi:hypothetical protein [Paucihalobacter sp.]|uniref:hypothetical protein n=1 Tax=Paucihalobacter sp. TaxID=2850405 RepID=UPI002FE1AA56